VKSNLRAALAVLLTSVLAVSGLSPVFANIYPTAHVAWGGARIDATQGVGVGITPSGSNPIPLGPIFRIPVVLARSQVPSALKREFFQITLRGFAWSMRMPTMLDS